MSKENVYIVLSHKHSLKKGTKDQWQVSEAVEFVSQLRPKHNTMSSAIGDYLNKKMISGARHGMDDYEKFERYLRTKYEKELAELDSKYGSLRASVSGMPLITDQFGNRRPWTVFDKPLNPYA